MEEVSSPTDVSSSLSEFVRKERLLKELYKENNNCKKTFQVDLNYNDEEIDGILQQMGKLLSPAGESDNKVYKHVIAETENKSIEEILNEAKELISDTTPVNENEFADTNESRSRCSETNFATVKDRNKWSDVNRNKVDYIFKSKETSEVQTESGKEAFELEHLKNRYMTAKKFTNSKKELSGSPQKIEVFVKKKDNVNKMSEEIQFLKNEIVRVNDLYVSCHDESNALKQELKRLEQKWQHRERQLLEENFRLSHSVNSPTTHEQMDDLQAKLNNANETIDSLQQSFTKATKEWNKKEIRLIDECNQLRYKLQNIPKSSSLDVEKLHEQLKDAQELNVKLKVDLDTCKEKCATLENLCGDLKKIIMDEEIAERVYANDNIPASVKQFLSSSSSSVINTLSHMFGCLSRGASRNRNFYSGHKNITMKSELFTTNESLMINDMKSPEYNDFLRELLKEKEQLKKQNLDLNRQIKELETIVRRRAHPNFSNVSEIIRSDESKLYEKESEMIKNLKKELLEKQHAITSLKNQLLDAQTQYDQNLEVLQGKIISVQEENMKMKEELEKKKIVVPSHAPKCKRKGRSCDPPTISTRNFRTELSAKEKEIQQLNKQLEELKKANKKLKDKENHSISSKEQSSDDIQLFKKYILRSDDFEQKKSSYLTSKNDEIISNESNVEYTPARSNSGITGPELKKESPGLKNDITVAEFNKVKLENDEIDTRKMPDGLPTINNSPNDYEQLSEKLNFLESRHQNFQKITCDLLKLLCKGELDDVLVQQHQKIEDKSSIQHENELLRYVSALKNVSG